MLRTVNLEHLVITGMLEAKIRDRETKREDDGQSVLTAECGSLTVTLPAIKN